MSAVMLGAVSAVVILAVFIGGTVFGWTAKARFMRYTRKEIEKEQTKEADEQKKAEDAAFQSMMSYNIHNVYGDGE